jgi:hypothetical protein
VRRHDLLLEPRSYVSVIESKIATKDLLAESTAMKSRTLSNGFQDTWSSVVYREHRDSGAKKTVGD